MGVSIELKKGNYQEIVNELAEKCKVDDTLFIEKVLLLFGEKAGDTYFILNNEYYDEFNSYYSVSNFLDQYYGIDDSFDVFLYNMKEANANWNVYDASDALGVELPERD